MVTSVSDDETLWRRVLDNGHHVTRSNGAVRISSTAFDDAGQAPSVDRASMCEELGGVSFTQDGPSNGVLKLNAGKIRKFTLTAEKPILDAPPNTPKSVKVTHAVDVVHAPVKASEENRENPAHALIQPNPWWANKNVFKRLKELLVQIADVEVLPSAQREP